MRDPRTNRILAGVISPFYGPKIFVAEDPDGEWEQAKGVALPEGGDEALERIWVIVPGEADGVLYAGGDPGVLFKTTDGGLTWELVRSLFEHPTRPDWTPGGGGLCLHSIAPWPGEPDKLALALSAVGVWLTDDGGETWRHGNQGLGARYLPEEKQEETLALCVHDLQRAPKRPERHVHPVPRRRLPLRRRRRDRGPRSATGCRRTSASRSSSTPPTPTAPT